MKNFFFVINKEKIYAYIVSVLTIVTLFFMSSMFNTEFTNTEATASNVIEVNTFNETQNTMVNR